MAVANKVEPTLADILENIVSMKETLVDVQTKISNLEKLEHKINEINENQNKFNSRVLQVEKSQEHISQCFDKQQVDIDKLLSSNKRLEKENVQLNNNLNKLYTLFYSEQEKRIQLEQYGRREMIEVSGIPSKDNENCVNIIKNICNLIDLNIENSIEIAHRIKNGDIIVKFRDRPSRDTLFRCKDKLKGKSTKDLGFKEERFIYINESLAFDNKKLLFNVRQKCRELGIKKVLTDNGIIKVKKDIPGSKWLTIKNRNDLDLLQ